MHDSPVNQRAQQILKMLVERYISDGNPVASRTLAEESALGLSPATIRNILADLEDLGYLASPHTSAGRIPTELGFRFFVDSLLTVKPLESEEVQALETKLDHDLPVADLLQSASSLVSSVTHLVGIVTMPRRNRVELRQVEFIALSGNRVLVILILNTREIQNRIIYTDRTYSASELTQAANFLNSHYAGQDLFSIRKELLQEMEHDKDHLQHLLQTAIDVANKAFLHAKENTGYVIAGQNHFLNYTAENNLERLRSLFDAFASKQEILNLLDHALQAEGVQIFIGKESGHEAFDECSIVTSSYSVDGQLVGTLGVIGPTRMPYERVIPAVDVTAKLLSAALNQED